MSRDTSQFYLGVASGKLTVSAAGNAFFNSSALFPVTPGINYQMRAYTKSTDAVGDYVHHWVQWYNSSDVYLSDAAHPGIQLGSSWTQVVFSATAPVGATKARYLFAWGNLGGAGRSVYVDDIKFQAP